jgi:hypothetical protein
MLLIAAVLILFLPLFYLLSDYSIESTRGIVGAQIREVTNKLVSESRETYYLGLYSREIVTVSMPDTITNMNTYIIDKPAPQKPEYYLNISFYKDGNLVSIPIPSEVPLITNLTCYTTNCYTLSNCTTCLFEHASYEVGVKNFRIETVIWQGRLAVKISQVYI